MTNYLNSIFTRFGVIAISFCLLGLFVGVFLKLRQGVVTLAEYFPPEQLASSSL